MFGLIFFRLRHGRPVAVSPRAARDWLADRGRFAIGDVTRLVDPATRRRTVVVTRFLTDARPVGGRYQFWSTTVLFPDDDRKPHPAEIKSSMGCLSPTLGEAKARHWKAVDQLLGDGLVLDPFVSLEPEPARRE